MNKQEQINQLRADVELIKAKLGMLDCQQPDSSNRSEKPNSSEGGDWSKAPDWAEWKAMDADGAWYWFESKPITFFNDTWRRGGECEHIPNYPAADKDWTQTLEQRPHQLFHIAIHEAISTEPDPYQVDWSKAPEWADSHSYDSDGTGWWFGSEMLLNDWRGDYDKSNLLLPSGLDWKQSKRRRPQ